MRGGGRQPGPEGSPEQLPPAPRRSRHGLSAARPPAAPKPAGSSAEGRGSGSGRGLRATAGGRRPGPGPLHNTGSRVSARRRSLAWETLAETAPMERASVSSGASRGSPRIPGPRSGGRKAALRPKMASASQATIPPRPARPPRSEAPRGPKAAGREGRERRADRLTVLRVRRSRGAPPRSSLPGRRGGWEQPRWRSRLTSPNSGAPPQPPPGKGGRARGEGVGGRAAPDG